MSSTKRNGFVYTCACRINLAFCSRMCENLHKKVELEIWYDGEEESFNAEFIMNNILVKGVSVQYRITK